MALPNEPILSSRLDSIVFQNEIASRTLSSNVFLEADDRGIGTRPPNNAVFLRDFFKDTDGSGSVNMARNFSGGGEGSTSFFLRPDLEEIFVIESINICILDSVIEMEDFPGLATGLGIGLRLQLTIGASFPIFDFLRTFRIKNTYDFLLHGKSLDIIELASGEKTMQAKFIFNRPVKLDRGIDLRLRINLSDDLSTLTRFEANCDGYVYNNVTVSNP